MLIFGVGIMIIGFTTPYTVGTLILQQEEAKTMENSRDVTIAPKNPYLTNITLHGKTNVTATFLSRDVGIPFQVIVRTNDGIEVWNKVFENRVGFEGIKFINIKPAGIYQVKISNLGTKPVSINFNINDQWACRPQTNQGALSCLGENYLIETILLVILSLIGYVGIIVIIASLIIIIRDRKKIPKV